jgi:amino acid adenylation domain-containing protein
VCNVLLFRYSGQEDIITGGITAGRDLAALRDLIGIFINPLVMRNFPAGGKTFAGFLNELKQDTLAAYENQSYPFGDLLEKVVKKKSLDRNPLFDVMLVFRNRDLDNLEVEGMKFSLCKPPRESEGHAQQDITFWAVEEEEKIRLELEYCGALFKQATMERMAGHFLTILKEAAANPGQTLSEIEMMSPGEKREVLIEFNKTGDWFSSDQTLHGLFEQQVQRSPDSTALVYAAHGDSHAVTYRELNRRAGRLAGGLKQTGVQPDDIIAVKMERSIEMMIAIFGILKAGGAFLPIDPDSPGERIDFIIKDSRARILLDKEYVTFSHHPVPRMIPLPVGRGGSSLAYVIYTSGTTGRPKGVLVEHANVTAYLHAFFREFDIQPRHTVLQLAASVFDVFIEEVFPVLVKGGKLVIPGPDERMDTRVLSRSIRLHGVNVIDCTPLLLNEFNNPGESGLLDIVISGGDVLKHEYVNNLLKAGAVYNTYGPTETTVCATYYSCTGPGGAASSLSIPIGKPITGYRVYILSVIGKLQPIGVAGELCVSGVGVTRGYLNRPELTAEKFTRTFMRASAEKVKIYRTGDFARWLPDGNIEFTGRIDHQIKIRGFRVEPGEIEARLLERTGIDRAVVALRTNENGDDYLCAYYTARESFTVMELKDYLLEKVPYYMVPASFVRLESLPLNASGKVDIQRLPEAVGPAVEAYAAPTNEVEERLVGIWAEILSLDKTAIGIDSSFFDLGGQSISAMKLTSRIRDEFGLRLPLAAFFRESSIRAIARLITDARSEKGNVAPGQEIEDHSFASVKFEKKKRRERRVSAQREI